MKEFFGNVYLVLFVIFAISVAIALLFDGTWGWITLCLWAAVLWPNQTSAPIDGSENCKAARREPGGFNLPNASLRSQGETWFL
jgi:hypothetical protein